MTTIKYKSSEFKVDLIKFRQIMYFDEDGNYKRSKLFMVGGKYQSSQFPLVYNLLSSDYLIRSIDDYIFAMQDMIYKAAKEARSAQDIGDDGEYILDKSKGYDSDRLYG
jgi:hypothetical protein